ncbi:MAG: YgaP family membrane protein [bacterium]
MQKNEGNLDRAVRVIAGLVILSLAFIGPQTAWGYIGLIPLVTGLIGFCPLYKVVGLSTCPLGSGAQEKSSQGDA